MASPLRKRAKLAPVTLPPVEIPIPIAVTDVFGTLAPETVIQILEEVYAASYHDFSRLRLLSHQFDDLVRPIRYRTWILKEYVDNDEISTAAVRDKVIQDVSTFTKYAILTHQKNWREAVGPFSETIPNVEVIEWNYSTDSPVPTTNSLHITPRDIHATLVHVKEDMESIFAQPPPHLREIQYEANLWKESCIKDLFMVRGAVLPNLDCLVLKNFSIDSVSIGNLESPQYFSTIRTLILHSRFLTHFLEAMNLSNASTSQIKRLELVDDGLVAYGPENSALFHFLQEMVQGIDTLESLGLSCEYAANLPKLLPFFQKHGPTLKVLKFIDTRAFGSSILPPLEIGHFQKVVDFCCVLKDLQMEIDVRASGTFNIVKVISKLPNLSNLVLQIPTLNEAETDTSNPTTPGLLAPDFNSAKSILAFLLRERISPYLRNITIIVRKLKSSRRTPPETLWFEHYYDWAPDVVGISGVGTIREMVWDHANGGMIPQTDYSYCWPLAA